MPPVQQTAGKPGWPSENMELGDYVLLELIGSGGGAKVFKARHKRMDRIVAVKTLPPSAMRDSDVVERFHREVKTAAKLIHPNIVTAFDAGDHQGVHYLVMEYVDGRPLTEIIEDHGPLAVDVALDYILQAARGLQYAHSLDVIHRDIKPSNLMLDARGTVKVLDMGLARVLGAATADHRTGAQADLPPSERPDTPRDGLTQVGQLLGTVGFMSPEQAKDGSLADQRTDIYALGCTLYYLLTGQLVYPGDLLQTVLAHAQKPIPRLRDVRPDVPEMLDSVFQQMMAKDPGDRYQSMSAVISDLEHCAKVPVRRSAITAHVPMPWQVKTAAHETVNMVSSKADTRKATLAAVGIDFGAATSGIAYMDEGGRPAAILNVGGHSMTRSSVLLRGKELLFGEPAVAESLTDQEHSLDQMKRYFGQKYLPRLLEGQQYPPEVFAALLLKRLVHDARNKLGELDDVVIGVPPSFDEVRRRATQDAGHIAGLSLVNLINETTAAAVALAHQQGYLGTKSEVIAPQNVVVVDLGAAAFDASVLTIEGSTISVLSTGGDDRLGGVEWDNRLIDFIGESLASKFGVDLRFEPTYAPRLRQQCEQVKCELSENDESTIEVEWEGQTARATIPRSYFDELTEDLVDQVQTILYETIQASGLSPNQIDRALLAGGATRMPAVRRVVGELLGPETKISQSPDEAVACGAALVAGRHLSLRRKEEPKFRLEDVASYSLGLVGTNRKTGRQVNQILIARNAKLPTSVKCTLKTHKDNQDSLSLHFVRGESESVDECRSIGHWVLKHLPPDLPAGSPITVTVRHGEDGRIRVLADTVDCGMHATRIITEQSGMTRDDLEKWRDWVETTYLHIIG